MKTFTPSIILIFTFCFLLYTKKGNAQTCTASFNYTSGPSGFVNYLSTSLGTNSTTTYFWNFGNGTTFSTTGISASNTYTTNGTYSVSLGISTAVPSCTALITQTVAVSNVTCSPNFISANGASGVVNFTSTSLSTNSTTVYFWNFGNGVTYTATGTPGIFVTNTYTANGTYSVSLFISSISPSCSSSITQTILVSTVPPCTINPAFSFTNTGGSNIAFQSTSTGTVFGTTYEWNFDDGAITSSTNIATVHTYSANGTYSVKLVVKNSGLCKDSVTNPIVIGGPTCSLNANFIYTLSATGNSIQLQSTSTGTVATTSYSWNFGDGNSTNGINSLSSHQFTANGNYVITLTADNNFSTVCISTHTQLITVNITPTCSLLANYTHTVNSDGLVVFNNTSLGTSTITNFFWDFGDGVYSTESDPIHTYGNAGIYYVNLRVKNSSNCRDSVIFAINVTGISCQANSNFNLTPAVAPQYWNAIPSYPWNVIAATWDWGDGSTSNSLYTSHTYAIADTYSVCLTVTTSCGVSSSNCGSYALYKMSGINQDMSMIYINVTKPSLSTGITDSENMIHSLDIYPNPNNGSFNLSMKYVNGQNITATIYSHTGDLVYEINCNVFEKSINEEIQLHDMSKGIYFVKVNANNKILTKKFIIIDQ